MFWIDVTIVFMTLLVLLMLVTMIFSLIIPVPYVPTPQYVVNEMVKAAKLKPKMNVYDLGAGDARLLITAKRSQPKINACGCEIVPTVWLLGKFRIWWAMLRMEYFCRDVFSLNLRNADCIFLYLTPSMMRDLKKKFDKELRRGTRIISYVFPFPGKKPIEEKEVPWLKGTRKLRVYTW